MVLFYMIWKKYNEIKITRNKMDFNNRKMKNHPSSAVICGGGGGNTLIINTCYYYLQELTPRLPSPSSLPVTWPAHSSVPMNKRPSKQYYRQLTLRATCPSESSTDTNFASKRSHHSALQPLPSSPPPSPATSSHV